MIDKHPTGTQRTPYRDGELLIIYRFRMTCKCFCCRIAGRELQGQKVGRRLAGREALEEVIPATVKDSLWVCRKPQRDDEPWCDHDAPITDEFYEMGLFLTFVQEKASKLKARDILCVAIVGHTRGSAGLVYISDGIALSKGSLERAVKGTRGTVVVVTRVPLLDSWASEHWTLLGSGSDTKELTACSETLLEKRVLGFLSRYDAVRQFGYKSMRCIYCI
jgi:hypothetical protein